MSVEESPNDQTATPEKVCTHTQLNAMRNQMTLHDLIKQYSGQEKKIHS